MIISGELREEHREFLNYVIPLEDGGCGECSSGRDKDKKLCILYHYCSSPYGGQKTYSARTSMAKNLLAMLNGGTVKEL